MAEYRLMDILYKGLSVGNTVRGLSGGPVSKTWESAERFKELKKNQADSANSTIAPSEKQITQDAIILIDLDYRKEDNPNGRFYDRLTLPVVPTEVSFDPDPQWATIASLGRNAPFYNYSGSEDTLSFQIDWFSKIESREDVLYACRWVEALTKADAYKSDPHRVAIIWGKDNKLFQDSTWIVHKASYKLSQFQRHKSMLPQQAYQEIVLKKVLVDNSTIENVFGSVYNFRF